MNHQQAIAYCQSLGGGARLPRAKEYAALSRAMGAAQPINVEPGYDGRGYRPNSLPEMDEQLFWSASLHPHIDVYASSFNGSDGHIGYGYRDFDRSVRCVVGR